ncbi:endonuclease G, mitochondrial [Trichonephila inaurata madagascariensis]|uniref:Endonuclease G, mitochondrial n=1 Tax=Trichonephila inaurata madagascariensis TaxID=2747483 RepID=A0A8X6YKE4_9ARAC|nr:endonuclease G, mitochondrial [Trichonephila inaurata madagascariensis]
MAFRNSFIAGAVGFFGGILYKDKRLQGMFGVKAADEFDTAIIDAVEPMGVDVEDPVSRTMQFGFPSYDTIRSRKSYVLSYDRRNRIPHWVFEHLSAEHFSCGEKINTSKRKYFEDDSLHPYFRSTNSDYEHSGFDKGHLAAAANHCGSQEYWADTFVLSNMAPQVGKGFNRSAWNKLERHVRKMVENYKNVYVVTGPLYMPRLQPDGKKYVIYQVIGPHDVAVPTHFFKVAVGEKENDEFDMEAYVMPNAPIDRGVPLKAFAVSIKN